MLAYLPGLVEFLISDHATAVFRAGAGLCGPSTHRHIHFSPNRRILRESSCRKVGEIERTRVGIHSIDALRLSNIPILRRSE